jgi:quinol monooxygenase YgiN
VLIVTGSIEARPDTIDRILELGLAHVQRSRLEPGCILHSIHRDVENELRVVFIEQWEDVKALDDHFHVPTSGEFVREAAALALRPPEISIFESEVAFIGKADRGRAGSKPMSITTSSEDPGGKEVAGYNSGLPDD